MLLCTRNRCRPHWGLPGSPRKSSVSFDVLLVELPCHELVTPNQLINYPRGWSVL